MRISETPCGGSAPRKGINPFGNSLEYAVRQPYRRRLANVEERFLRPYRFAHASYCFSLRLPVVSARCDRQSHTLPRIEPRAGALSCSGHGYSFMHLFATRREANLFCKPHAVRVSDAGGRVEPSIHTLMSKPKLQSAVYISMVMLKPHASPTHLVFDIYSCTDPQ